MNFFKGPSLIVNSGSLNNTSLTKVDKYGKYSVCYVVGGGNRSFREVQRVVNQLIVEHDLGTVKLPWKHDERTNMVSIFASSKSKVPVLTHDDEQAKAGDGDFCKINVTPAAYVMQEQVVFRLPDGSTGSNLVEKKGVKLYLNGIKLLEPTIDEELF